MLVRMEVWKANKKVEEYVAPPHSWIQTESAGSQAVKAITEPSLTFIRGDVEIRQIPMKPPEIPEKIKRVLSSRDVKWGKNGWEWLGNNREIQGGTTLDRARELFAWAGSGLSKQDFPVELNFEGCMSVMGDEKYCKALKEKGD